MKKNTGLVKCILGLVLVVGVIVGGMLGLDIDFNIEPIDTTVLEDTMLPEDDTTVDTVVDETTVETPDTPADSTEAEDDVPTVDESVEQEVTEPTTDETENVVTEGEN
jgi:hypothetical protein